MEGVNMYNKNVKKRKMINNMSIKLLYLFQMINTNKNFNVLEYLRDLGELFASKNRLKEYERSINSYMKDMDIDSFNNFFNSGKIEIKREQVSRNSMKKRSNSIDKKLFSKNIFISENNRPFYFYYKTSNIKKIPFEFQTVIADDSITNDDKRILLAFINIVRKFYVDNLLEILTKNYFFHCDHLPQLDLRCDIVAVGSTELTSNYDITIGGIIFPNEIINEYNKIFFIFWNNFSARVFDTNLYGSTFFLTTYPDFIKNTNEVRDKYQILKIRNNRSINKDIFYLPPLKILGKDTIEFGDKIMIEQYEWLIIKTMLHVFEYHINKKYVNRYFDKIVLLVQKLINKNNTELNLNKENKELTTYGKIFGKINNSAKNNNIHNHNINSLISISNKTAVQNIKRRVLSNKFNMDDKGIFLDDLSERIEKYEDLLNKIKVNQLVYESVYTEFLHSNISMNISNRNRNSRRRENEMIIYDFLCELIDTISKSNFYGSETYFCMGTIYHVLGYIQNLGPFNMEPYYYKQSAIENYIDIFRYYKKIKKNQEYSIIKFSKYAYRTYDALIRLRGDNNSDINLKKKRDLFMKISKKLKTKTVLENIQNNSNTIETKRSLSELFNIDMDIVNISYIEKLLDNILMDIINNI